MRTLITLVVLLFCLQLWAQVPDTTSVAPGRLIIKVNQSFQTIGTRSDGIIETDQTWFNNLAVQYQIDVLRQMYVGSTRAYQQNKYLICFPDSIDLETVVSSFDLQSSVQDVRYDFYVHLCTDDPFNSYQWNLQRINANAGYYTIAGSIQAPQAVRIAVVDTGIDFNHPDLTNNILRDNNNNVIGYNVLSQINDTMDDNGHGTLVAGVIAAQTNNNAGISSLVVGNNVKLMPIKAFNRYTDGLLSNVCEGIQWAIDQDANVINCSWVVYTYDVQAYELSDLIDANEDVLFVAARGISGTTLPASWSNDFANVVAVGGSNTDYGWEYDGAHSNNWISVCAPSGSAFIWNGAHDSTNGIISTLPIYNPSDPYKMHYSQNQSPSDPYYDYQCGAWQESTNYDYLKGTSLSAAHVSGLMGMLWAKNYTAISNQTMSMQDLKDIVVKSAQDFNTNDYSVYNSWGSGVINAHEALMEPHPNLSLRKYWIGTNDYDYPLPDNTLVWNLPSMEWGSSQAIKLRIKNKWAQGSNVSIELSTTDPNITFSYPGENDSYGFGTIAAETTVDTANMWIWDWSNQVRHNVPITITISANGMPDRIYTVYMNILQSTSAIVASIDMLPGETFSTDLVVSNLGTGNEDELIVGTSAGRLFCYRNNTWNHIGTLPQGVSVNPAVGDINADGYKEIVSIDSSGNVHVYDRFFTQMRTYPCFSNEITVGNVIMEDITGDNILDIIYATKRSGTSTQDAGVRIIDFINNTQLSYLSNLVILAAPAVGDVDHIPGYEIVVPYSNSNGFFCFKVLKYYEGILVASIEHTEQLAIESVISPIIVDINEDLSREIAFQLSYPNGSSSLIYYSIPESGFIYGGDFLGRVSLFSEVVKLNDLSSDVAIVSSDVSTLMGLQYDVRISNGMVGSDEFSLAYISTDSQVKSLIVDQLLPPEAGYLPKQIVIMTANIITYTKLRTNPSNPSSMYCEEIWEYRTDLGSNVTLQSMATAKAGLNRMLYAITDDGVLYGYAYVNSTSRSTECSQRSQTSRHTRCYEQPVPHVVNGTLFIKHPFVVDQCTSAISSNITINQGVLGRFEYNTGLSIARSELSLCGSEDNPVFLTSMSSKSKNYWKVIQVKNGSDLTMNWAKVSGAIQALDISNTGYRSIENCTFENNRQIVNCYNATVNMFNNFLTDAGYAISAYHFSSPMLNYTFSLQNGLNEISGNEYGIFSDSSTPHLKDGHNNLESSVYNLYLQNLILSSDPIYAQNNWWGYDDFSSIKLSIHPVEVVECVPYDDEPNRTIVREDTQINMFIEGYSNMINGDYRGAMNCFYNVLADSLINDHDITSLYSLFECHKKLSLLDQYEDYLNQSILESEYTPLHKVMKNVRALIYRETERYSQAIEHYETILLNSPSFQDSCYAVIDLGDTYLESNGGYRGQLTEYVPVNSDFHQQNRNLLLNSILKLHIGNAVEVSSPQLQLMGNYPNPFNPTTIIRFNLQSEAKVKIDIYNIKGQKVFTIVDEIRSAGLNSVLWNGRDYDNTPVSSGIYFYRVSCDGSSKVAKMMLIK